MAGSVQTSQEDSGEKGGGEGCWEECLRAAAAWPAGVHPDVSRSGRVGHGAKMLGFCLPFSRQTDNLSETQAVAFTRAPLRPARSCPLVGLAPGRGSTALRILRTRPAA